MDDQITTGDDTLVINKDFAPSLAYSTYEILLGYGIDSLTIGSGATVT